MPHIAGHVAGDQNWTTADDTAAGIDQYGRPTWLPSTEEWRTPEMEWEAFTAQQRPFWSTRAPLRDVGERLRARYLLAAPYMGEAGLAPTFGQFLQDYPGSQVPIGGATQAAMPGYMAGTDEATLRARAQEAALAATQPIGQYMEGLTPETAEFNRRAWLASQFGSEAENAMANQMRVAQMLATRRPTQAGGVGTYYQGRMGDAIRNALGRMYQQRVYQGDQPRESFLNWYLQQTGEQQA